MSKVDDTLKVNGYQAYAYVTLTEFLSHYGIDDAAAEKLPATVRATYRDYVNNANRTVEAALYKFADQLPLPKTSESFTYAKTMAFHWAQYEKLTDENAPNAKDKKSMWKEDKVNLIGTMQSQPQKTTTRSVVSSGFEDDAPTPYSQSYGLSDFL